MALKSAFAVRRKTALKEPSMFRVVLLNDDYTPMDFVVDIIMLVFNKNEAEAEAIMLNIHKKGRGLAGIYTEDIAKTKAAQVETLAASKQYPLVCIVEPN